MPQQAARRIDAPADEASSVTQFWNIPQSPADIFAFTRNGWPLWNSAQSGKAHMPMMKTPHEIMEMNRKARAFSTSEKKSRRRFYFFAAL
jgi:hypothetical protein